MYNSFDLAEIYLPDDIKIQLESLNYVNLTLSSPEIYLEFNHDLQLNLDKIFDLHSTVPYIDVALNRIIIEIFGGTEIKISQPKYRFLRKSPEVELSVKGLLNKQNAVAFICWVKS